MGEKQLKEKIKIIDIKPPQKRKRKEKEEEIESVILKEKETEKVAQTEEVNIDVFKKEIKLEKPEKEKIEKEKFSEEFPSDFQEFQEEEFIYQEPTLGFKKTFISKLSLKKSLLYSILLFLGGGFLFYYLSFVVFARAEIKIITNKVEIPFSSKITLDNSVSQINYDKSIIPSNVLTFKESVSEDFKSTGIIKDEKKATGTVILFNNFSTAPQVLVATTRLETPDGKIFRLDSRTVIPGATLEDGKLIPSSVEAKVTADQPGPEYNIGPCELPDCKFTIVGFKGTPKYEKFYAISKTAMTGGTRGTALMVSAEDISKGEEVVLKKLAEALEKSIQNKFPSDLVYLPFAKSGLKVTNLKADAQTGDIRDHFNISAEGEIKIITFKKEVIKEFIQNSLEKDEKYEFYKEPEYSLEVLKTDFNRGILEANLNAKQTLRYIINEEEIKDLVKGKSQKEVLKSFENKEGIKEVIIKLKPYWLFKIPKNNSKIKISID